MAPAELSLLDSVPSARASRPAREIRCVVVADETPDRVGGKPDVGTLAADPHSEGPSDHTLNPAPQDSSFHSHQSSRPHAILRKIRRQTTYSATSSYRLHSRSVVPAATGSSCRTILAKTYAVSAMPRSTRASSSAPLKMW
jgi:hypothetical protein